MLSNLWNREPVLVIGFVEAILALVAAFGLDLSAEQIAGIVAVTSTGLALFGRSKVSPLPPPPPEVPANVELGEE